MSLTPDISPTEESQSSEGLLSTRLRDVWHSKLIETCRTFLKRLLYRLFRLGGELTAVVLGLALAGSWIAMNVLDRQSTDLTILRPNIKMWFADAFEGQDAEFGRLELSWLPASDYFVVTIEDAEVQGKDGTRVESFELIRATLAMGNAARIRPRLINADVSGGALSYVEDANGDIVAGLGLPDSVGQVGPVYRNSETENSSLNLKKYFEDLEFIQIRNANLYIKNAVSGIDIQSNIASMSVALSDDAGLTLTADGVVEQPSGQMPFSISSILGEEFQDMKLRMSANKLRPDEIAPKKGRFWDFQGLAAPVDLTLSVDFSRLDGLRSADVEIDVGEGSFTLLRNETQPNFPIKSLLMRASLAPGEERMDIQQLDLSSPKLSFDASGFLTELGKLNDGDINSSPTFDLAFRDIWTDATPFLVSETKIKALNIIGQADVDSRQLTIESGRLSLFESEHDFNGTFVVSETNQPKYIVLNSAMSGRLTPKEFLSLWPADAIGGARRWIDRSVLGGKITTLDLDMRLDEAFFDAPALTEDRFKLQFAGENIEAQYMQTMPNALNVSGQGNILGNRLFLNLERGNVEGLTLSGGTVEIPVLLPKGGDISIQVEGQGLASEVLRVADYPPFEIAKRYGVDPFALQGQGDISVSVTRPLLEFFPREQILYDVKGQFTGINAPFDFGRYEITDGAVEIQANRQRAFISGPVNIGPWRADMRWQETFGDAASLTQYGISGTVTAEDLDRFGFASRSWFDGRAAVTIEAEGQGMDIASADIDVDLTNAELSVERIWMKPAAAPAQLTGRLNRTLSNGYSFEDLSLKGDGIDVGGQVELDAELKTRDINLTSVDIASVIKGAVRINPDRNIGQLGVQIDAEFMDVSPWTEDLMEKRVSSLDVPFLLKGEIETLVLDPEYTVTNSIVEFVHTGEVVQTARMDALSDGNPFKLELLTKADLKRELSVNIPDASKAVNAFLGMDNTTGGRLNLSVNLPAAGEDGAYVGEADMRDFRLTRAPAMAQLLSIASLTGLADTLTSGSMQFEKFKLPFTMLGDDIAIRDARLYGPALGMTANGDIDLDLRVLDFDGTLVPAYTANSILGDIPVLGDIFVQEKDGGLFALTYTVSGPFEKTQIAVNPLSALTPGFLRGIFKRDRSDIDDAMKDAIEDVTPKEAGTP